MYQNTVTNDIIMKQFWKITGFALFWVMWGVVITCCVTKCGKVTLPEDETLTQRRDTVVINDTITIVEPVPDRVVAKESVSRKLPISKTDTIFQYIDRDSIEVEIPIVQKEYKDSTYHAWISGYEPKLDSLYVFQKTEYITIETFIKQKKKHWHIGPTIGYGYTTKGFQPFFGFSLTYSILEF